ncbi:serum albumin 2 [Esox lucius]|uniref:Albumin domain-containing protein n=1 Tax=Esox lucius TaxID=8010 RepID=A0A3P9AQ62_ESOLU|nr:serum albumin 2 [Esox lucius]
MQWLDVSCLLTLFILSAGAQSQNQVCTVFTEAKKDGFEAMALVGLAQNLPDSLLVDMVPLVQQAFSMGVLCCSDEPPKDCNRDVADLFQSAVCSSETLVETSNLTHCCEKTGSERTDCFVDHKAKIPRDLSFTSESPAADQCEDFKKDRKGFIERFIFRFSKRNPMLPPHVILAITKAYGEVLATCCGKEEAEAQTCFQTKKPTFQYAVRNRVNEIKALCITQNKYGDRIVKAKKLIQYSQKMPQASFPEMSSIVDKIVMTTAPCCSGDMVTCMKWRKILMDEVCGNRSVLSRVAGLKACCKEHAIDRGSCVEAMKPDAKPESLSVYYDLHTHIAQICLTFTKTPDAALAQLIYEISVRHPESSQQVILRFVKEAEQAFLRCCQREDQAGCVKTAMAGCDINKKITEEIEYYKKMCAAEATLKDDNFEKSMIVYYTRIMPQASFAQLHMVSQTLADVFHGCCNDEPNGFLLPCAEEKLTNILDAICNDYDYSSFNPRIAHCCNQSYSTRRPCFLALHPDADFTPPGLVSNTFPMGPELCTDDRKKLLLSGKRLLYGLVRHKTNITEDHLKTISANYHAMREMCCATEDHGACFTQEAPKLVSESAKLVNV